MSPRRNDEAEVGFFHESSEIPRWARIREISIEANKGGEGRRHEHEEPIVSRWALGPQGPYGRRACVAIETWAEQPAVPRPSNRKSGAGATFIRRAEDVVPLDEETFTAPMA
jgi:hypothetical protein